MIAVANDSKDHASFKVSFEFASISNNKSGLSVCRKYEKYLNSKHGEKNQRQLIYLVKPIDFITLKCVTSISFNYIIKHIMVFFILSGIDNFNGYFKIKLLRILFEASFSGEKKISNRKKNPS